MLQIIIYFCIAVSCIWYLNFFFLNGKCDSIKKEGSIKNDYIEIGVVLGSGGHTFEILEIIKLIKNENIFFHIFYCSNDCLSKGKAEIVLQNYKKNFIKILRCRNVNESYIIACIKFFFSFLHCVYITYKLKNMNIIIANGPGVCLPVIFSLLFRKYIFFKQIKIVYLESVCKIYSLSVTAKLVYYFADMFVVFSEHLQNKYKKAKFYGYLF
ncbi:dolichol-linked oligosaccharide biosynthesis enzyme, putative [Hepatocystis sp. ex Piliocolobus tephrosceles]|nr:dolichol-linked oligosaccharide biosynthesis enzyme, putative [Hepatocystis sp. ex Piliocolobus tephrosceles]